MSASRTVSITRLAVGGMIIAAAATACSWFEPSSMALGRTSVLLVVIDTLRADRLGAYGYDVPTSPHIDDLADDGVLMTRHFANAAWTRPSMAGMLTGLYPRTTGVSDKELHGLAPDLVLLSERFQRKGYVTLGVNTNPNAAGAWGFSAGFDEWAGSSSFTEVQQIHKGVLGKIDGSLATARALDLVDRWQGDLDARPYYLQVLYVDPHVPRNEPEDAVQRMAEAGSTSPDYDAEVADVDRAVGALLEGLDDRGLLDDTLVVLTSDHGEGLDSHVGVPRSNSHGVFLYDSVLHVPLIFAHPALPQGKQQTALTSLVSLAPTILDLLGAPPGPGDMQGASFARLVRDPDARPTIDRTVYAETRWEDVDSLCVRTETLKLVQNEGCRSRERFPGSGDCVFADGLAPIILPITELYAVASGVAENPLENSRHDADPRTTTALYQVLSAWSARTPARAPYLVLDTGPGVIEGMRALGYIE